MLFSRELSHGAVVTNAEECTDLAYSILKSSEGSAVDAAITATFCNGLLIPQATGIGGGFLATIFIKSKNKIETLNSREVAPLGATPELYEGNATIGLNGGLSIAVPTEVKGLWELHQKYGKLPWRSLIQPVINLAEKGFKVPYYLGNVLSAREERIRNNSLFRYVCRRQIS